MDHPNDHPIPTTQLKHNTDSAILLSFFAFTLPSLLLQSLKSPPLNIFSLSLPPSHHHHHHQPENSESKISGDFQFFMTEMAQVGVRAIAAADTATDGSSRKRKIENQEIISCIEMKSSGKKYRRRVMITPENENSGDRSFVEEDRCKSFGSSDHGSGSCCSSNGSSDQRIHQYADLEESVGVETSVYYSSRERRETTPSSHLRAELSSDELDSTARPAPPATAEEEEDSTRRRRRSTKMPTESELDEFFSDAEKKIQKRFADKYNYDVVKDEPLEGRYQWVRLKP